MEAGFDNVPFLFMPDKIARNKSSELYESSEVQISLAEFMSRLY